ncbi:hypothetical protein AB1Y20_012811 [Prymnesium parvum]|uniref:C3H1-type domain-containing protein n=1 Tax=Prymnesium parvum TaxID=97485 RepID=A0AB34IJP5_PRYPA
MEEDARRRGGGGEEAWRRGGVEARREEARRRGDEEARRKGARRRCAGREEGRGGGVLHTTTPAEGLGGASSSTRRSGARDAAAHSVLGALHNTGGTGIRRRTEDGASDGDSEAERAKNAVLSVARLVAAVVDMLKTRDREGAFGSTSYVVTQTEEERGFSLVTFGGDEVKRQRTVMCKVVDYVAQSKMAAARVSAARGGGGGGKSPAKASKAKRAATTPEKTPKAKSPKTEKTSKWVDEEGALGPNGLARKKGGNPGGSKCERLAKGECPFKTCSYSHA